VSISRIESAVADLVAEYQTMTVANGYRNDLALCVVHGIRPAERITSDIEIGIQDADEFIRIIDDMCSAFESEHTIYVEATIKGGLDGTENLALVESVLHDLKRCTAKLVRKYLVDAQAWNIMVGRGITAYHDVFTLQGKALSKVGMKFTLHLRSMTEDFV